MRTRGGPLRRRNLACFARLANSHPLTSIRPTSRLDFKKLSSYSAYMPRRRAGTLIAIELDILQIGMNLKSGEEWFYGFSLAKQLAAAQQGKGLTAHGTLYKALGRMAEAGLLESEWEDPEVAAAENRPRRRLYKVSGLGSRAWIQHTAPGVTRTQLGTVTA